MLGRRILLFIVMFGVVIAESWTGVSATEPAQKIFALAIGATVLAMLILYGAGQNEANASPLGWLSVALASLFIVGGAFFLPTEILPRLAPERYCATQ